ncbi:MAG: hypothetical protein J2P19_16490 [Pseudonocardia sp.]|nr:hypothetical protein [Pseudonocardia sp.]
MAVLLGVAAALLTIAVLVGLLVLVGYLSRRWLRDRAQRLLAEIAGPAVVRSLPPRTALQAVLAPVYGDQVVLDDVLIAVLGGAGREWDGRDTLASRVVDAHFRLRSLDETTCRTESTWTYEFSGVQNNHLMVIFGTHDRRLAAAVMQERAYPLYELWLLNNEDELEDFVRGLRSNVEIGITYRDTDKVVHSVPPCAQAGEEVKLGDYPKLVRLPNDLSGDDLHIMRYDLHDLADPDHVVDSVQNVTLRVSTNAENRGFFTWTAPYPCFVRHVEFDMSDLAREGEKLAYRVSVSVAGWYRLNVQRGWIEGESTLHFELNSWMLAGHGVTLVWRSIDGAERESGSSGQ